jgi:transglutaminase-like putative cysteine protease
MRYRITHTTEYRYQDNVVVCQNHACLSPRTSPRQICRSSKLQIRPTPTVKAEHRDFFGNRLHYFAIQAPHQHMIVTAISEVDMQDIPILDLAKSPAWESVRDSLEEQYTPTAIEARSYRLNSPYIEPIPELLAYAHSSFTPERPLLEAVNDLMARVFNEFTYDPHFSTIVTPLSDVMEHRRGVCQDFAHLMIACIRGLGLPARYVSGYLETLPPPGQVKLQGADASHAWLSVYCPEFGWVDFDPTNNMIPASQHITVAWGRDYGDVTPLKGVIYGGGEHILTVGVDVERI